MQSSETSSLRFSHCSISQACVSCPKGVSVCPCKVLLIRRPMKFTTLISAASLTWDEGTGRGRKTQRQRNTEKAEHIPHYIVWLWLQHRNQPWQILVTLDQWEASASLLNLYATCSVISCQPPACFLLPHPPVNLGTFIFPHPFKSFLPISWDSAVALQKQQNKERDTREEMELCISLYIN